MIKTFHSCRQTTDSGLSSNIYEEENERNSVHSSPYPSQHLNAVMPLQRSFSSGYIAEQEQPLAETSRHTAKSMQNVELEDVATEPFVQETDAAPERTFKVIFIGDASVGKSSFIWRVTKNAFTTQLGSTLGVDFQIKTLRVDGTTVSLQLWDTAGQVFSRETIFVSHIAAKLCRNDFEVSRRRTFVKPMALCCSTT